MTPNRRPRRRALPVIAAVLLLVLLAAGAVWSNVLGVGERLENLVERIELAIDPPPDRPIQEAVRVTPRPFVPATPTPVVTAPGSLDPWSRPPTPTPGPVRGPVEVDLLDDPEAHFITELDKDWCAVAGTQMVLNIHGMAPVSNAFQRELAGRIHEWESRRDSRNGGWGPAAIAAALEAYGVPGYEVRAYDTRADALRDAAVAISTLRAPVVLLTWRGAHTWVMTGYRASADPTVFDDARVSGAFILDPWFPRISSIWGESDGPGVFQDASEMRRNYLPWKRPEGLYPDRDGLFIAVVPTLPTPAGD